MLHIGFGNTVPIDRVIAIVKRDTAPIRRLIREGQDKGAVIDATFGRETRGVIFMDNGNIVLSAVGPTTLKERMKDW